MLRVECRRFFVGLILPQLLSDDLQHLLAIEIVAFVECLGHSVQDSNHALS